MRIREEIILTEEEATIIDNAITLFGTCSELTSGECGEIAEGICDLINDFLEYAHIDLQTE